MYKSIFLGLILFIFPVFVHSEWNSVAESSNAKIFVDPGSIRKVENDIKSIWTLKNFSNKTDDIQSRQFKLELNCKSDQFRKLIRVSFSGPFSSGLPIKDYFKPEDWHSIDDDELFKAVFNSICSDSNK